MGDVAAVPAAEGLFVQTDEGPRLLGSRCATCGTPTFPRRALCPNPDCERSAMQDARFGPRGRLISVAIQSYPPPPPTVAATPYVPYGVGLVDLPEGLRVLGRLDHAAPHTVALGGPVELVLGPLGRDADGREVISWQWKPL